MILPLPKAKAKPQSHQTIAQIEKLVRIFATTVPAFFCRENPISRNAKPACMNMTSTPATITQVVLSPELSMTASLRWRNAHVVVAVSKISGGPLVHLDKWPGNQGLRTVTVSDTGAEALPAASTATIV